MHLDLSADDVLRTTRAVRKRIDFDRPVPDEVLRECMELALQAPSGSNGQNWKWVLVTDRDKIAQIAALYQQAFAMYETMEGVNAATIYQGPDEDRLATQERVMDSARHLADRMADIPALLIPCVPGRIDNSPNIMAAAAYGSVIPAAWSFMLAARERGLGTCWTTLHLFFEEQVAEILDIPFADATQIALISIGYTKGTEFKAAKREPLEHSVGWNSWPG